VGVCESRWNRSHRCSIARDKLRRHVEGRDCWPSRRRNHWPLPACCRDGRLSQSQPIDREIEDPRFCSSINRPGDEIKSYRHPSKHRRTPEEAVDGPYPLSHVSITLFDQAICEDYLGTGQYMGLPFCCLEIHQEDTCQHQCSCKREFLIPPRYPGSVPSSHFPNDGQKQ
jgi:hypothetical protein